MSNTYEIPYWNKYTLSIEEAAINVNIKMYIFDHLRMYKFAYSSSVVMYSLNR